MKWDEMFILFHSFTHYSNIDENKINKLIDSWMNCFTHYFGIVAFVNDKPNGCWKKTSPRSCHTANGFHETPKYTKL